MMPMTYYTLMENIIGLKVNELIILTHMVRGAHYHQQLLQISLKDSHFLILLKEQRNIFRVLLKQC